MKPLAVVLGLACCMLLCIPSVVRADALDDGVRRVGSQLMCPVCEGETVADSPSALAGDMRSVIRTRLAAGESDSQILNEFVASYGDSILTEPPKRGVSLGVWIGPIVALALGVFVVSALLHSWRRPVLARMGKAESAAVDGTIETEFRQFREDLEGESSRRERDLREHDPDEVPGTGALTSTSPRNGGYSHNVGDY